ncbi:MAG: dihydrolipoamide acetyltransferase, partial [Clostridia bacterium]|nr:dihydrolipoamide acetyltransferase [Clostridia bacterium]
VSFALDSTFRKPVVVDNTVQIREIMHISVNFNHDLVDGAPAARFLNTFRDYVEKSPQSIMVQ